MILSERQKKEIRDIRMYYMADSDTKIPEFGEIYQRALQFLHVKGYHNVQRRSPDYANLVIRIFYKKNFVEGSSTYGAQFYTEDKHLFTTTLLDGTKLALNSSQFMQVYLSSNEGKIKFDTEFVDVYCFI